MSKEDKKAKRRKKALFYRIGFPLVKLFHGRQKVLYEEAVDQGEPVIFVANHAQAFGPISMIVNFDRTVRPWIAADVMFKETAADFVFVQFFAGNIKKHKRWNMSKRGLSEWRLWRYSPMWAAYPCILTDVLSKQ